MTAVHCAASNVLGLCITLWAAPPEVGSSAAGESVASAEPAASAQVEPARPLEGGTTAPEDTGLDVGGAAPLQPLAGQGTDGPAVPIAAPFGIPERRVERPLDPKATTIARLDVMIGPVWRARPLDGLFQTSVEVGRMHGFSGSFHTGFIVASDRESVRALDVPIGVGAVARGRLRRRPGFASIGLTAGLLVHRAATDDAGVIHRVDPDFRLPIRFAWTFATAGLSVALEQGYSVRNRSYDRRGAEVWARHAYRVGLTVGLHLDFVVRPARRRSPRGSVQDGTAGEDHGDGAGDGGRGGDARRRRGL